MSQKLGNWCNQNVNRNTGLLVDYFAHNTTLGAEYFSIIDHYRKVFDLTLKFGYCEASKVFFEHRIFTRINPYYARILNNGVSQVESIILNGRRLSVHFQSILLNVKKHFSKVRQEYLVVSQCDPNDLNICIDGMILDNAVGGYNPILAEVATFLWYNILQGEYLSLKYHPVAYEMHDDIFSKMPFIGGDNEITYRVRPIRLSAINYYLDTILKPFILRTKYERWYEDLKNYMAMKILGVFNITLFEKKDYELSLAYLSLFYTNFFQDYQEFKTFLNEII